MTLIPKVEYLPSKNSLLSHLSTASKNNTKNNCHDCFQNVKNPSHQLTLLHSGHRYTGILKLLAILLLIYFSHKCQAQVIYNAFVLNKNIYYKTTIPKKSIQTITYYNPKEKFSEKYISNFNDSGMIIKQVRIYQNGIDNWFYTNNNLNKTRLSAIHEGTYLGAFKFKEIYSYDSNHHLISITTKNKNNNISGDTSEHIVSIINIRNDEHGRPIETKSYHAKHDTTTDLFDISTANYFTNNNNKISIVFPDSTRNKTIFSIHDGFIVQGFNDQYDSKGELTFLQPEINSSLSAKKLHITYMYDKYGNYKKIIMYSVHLNKKGKEIKRKCRTMKIKYEY